MVPYKKPQKHHKNHLFYKIIDSFKSVISILMNKPFAQRTHLLVKEFVQLKTLIADYPLLCCEEQVQLLYLLVCICPKDENALAFDSSFFLQVSWSPLYVYFL